ncbi:MAG TPA: hypothetical protein GX709_04255 [Clostridiales bacterium]|nr:hypothetical protein [Clostridiales bacterium]
MRVKKLVSYILIFFVFAIVIWGVGNGMVAFAGNVTTTPRYLVNGEWIIQNGSNILDDGNGRVLSEGDEMLNIFIYSQNSSGEGSLANNSLTNFSTYNIQASAYKANKKRVVHEKFEIYKDNSIYKTSTFSSDGTIILLSQSLADGLYKFTYRGSLYKSSLYRGEITYEFAFIVDNTNPICSLKTLDGANISNGAYSNKSSRYTASDKNFSKIFYRKNSGTWSSTTTTSFSVSGQNNNGFWEFYAVDKIGNKSSTSSFYFDNILPEGTIKDANDNTLQSGGVTNKPFKALFTDANLDTNNIYVKNPDSSTFAKYTNNSLINGVNGKYVFKATDKAGNTSAEISYTLDKINPTLKIYLDNVEVQSGLSLNGEAVKVAAFDEGGAGILETYVKKPGSNVFEIYNANTTYTNEGKYEFYTKDKAGNESNKVNILIDRTPPILNLFTDKDVTGDSYAAINKIKCSSLDNLSGIFKMFVKTSQDIDFVEYADNTYVYTEGEVKFYGMDKAQNKSLVHSIILDATPPVGNIYVDSEIYENQYVTKPFKYQANDSTSGIKKLEVFYDNLWKTYDGEVIETIMPEGIYKFKSIDNAGNVSDVKSVILSTSPPSVEIYVDDIEVEDGIWLNRPFSFKAIPYDTEIVKNEIRYPNSEIWQTYIENSVIGFPLENGTYSFRTKDDKGIYSKIYTVNVDTIKPQIKGYLDGYLIEKKYLKGSAISFEYEDLNETNIYIKVPGGADFSPYQLNTKIYSEGKYFAYAKDYTGNESDTIEFVLDNSKKSISLTNTKIEDSTLSTFTLTSEILTLCKNPTVSYETIETDINLAPIERVQINGVDVLPNEEIETLSGGEYLVKVLDKAGNEATYTFTSNVIPISYEKIYTIWYEVSYIDATPEVLEKIQAFQNIKNTPFSYNNFTDKNAAYEYSYQKEEALLKEINWSIDDVFSLDELDRANRKEGPAYIYRHATNEEQFVIYFTKDRLLEVMQSYANKHITKKTFLDGDIIGQIDDSFEYIEGIISNEITLDNKYTFMLQGEVLLNENVFNQNGKTLLVANDKYGNSLDIPVNIISNMPIIEITKSSITSILDSENTYLTSIFAVQVIKENAPITILEIYKGENLVKTIYDDALFEIKTSGIYTLKAYNHSGIVNVKTIYLSLLPQNANFDKEDVLVLNVSPSKDIFAPLETISVFVKYPTSAQYVELFQDDLGNAFSPSKKTYTFLKSGDYKVILEDRYRRGSNSIEATYQYELLLTPIQIEGIKDGESTKNKTLTYIPRKNIETKVLKDGELLPQNSSYSFRKEGTYKIIETNADGITQEFTFSVESSDPSLIQDVVKGDKGGNGNKDNIENTNQIEESEKSKGLSKGAIVLLVIFGITVFAIIVSLIIKNRKRRY